MKDFRETSWKVTEQQYREDPALSYSILSRYAKEGVKGLREMVLDGKKLETRSLGFGSLLDCLVTDASNFNDRYYIATVEMPTDNMKAVCDRLLSENEGIKDPRELADDVLVQAYDMTYNNNYSPATKARIVKTDGFPYMEVVLSAGGKTIVSTADYRKATEALQALQDDRHVKEVLASPCIYYQLKYKISMVKNPLAWREELLPGKEYRCMFDVIVVDHERKTVSPYDLKTTREHEDDFGRAIYAYRYDIQAESYRHVLVETLRGDKDYGDYQVEPFRFIVINKDRLRPVIWEYDHVSADPLNRQYMAFTKYGILTGKNWKGLYNEVYAILDYMDPHGNKEKDANGKLVFAW
jgi:hypothetical protein